MILIFQSILELDYLDLKKWFCEWSIRQWDMFQLTNLRMWILRGWRLTILITLSYLIDLSMWENIWKLKNSSLFTQRKEHMYDNVRHDRSYNHGVFVFLNGSFDSRLTARELSNLIFKEISLSWMLLSTIWAFVISSRMKISGIFAYYLL